MMVMVIYIKIKMVNHMYAISIIGLVINVIK